MKSNEFITEWATHLVSIWKNNNNDKLYIFQDGIGGYSYTIEYVGGPMRGKSKRITKPYDDVKALLQDAGWWCQED